MASRKELLSQVYKIVPPMLETFHKGQLGRVAVIGGSEDYTGAPYFSAMASARLGADMVSSSQACASTLFAALTITPDLVARYMRARRRASDQDLLPSADGAPIHAIRENARGERDARCNLRDRDRDARPAARGGDRARIGTGQAHA